MTDIFTFRLREMAAAIDARFNAIEQRALPAGGYQGQILTKAQQGQIWTDPPPIVAVGPIPPSNPVPNQLWVDTN